MKILLLALVCFASTQVYGSDLEDRIKKAIKILEFDYNVTKLEIEALKDDLDHIKALVIAKPEVHLQQVTKAQNDALEEVKAVAKNLTARANEGKLPEEVIKCIAKEEQAAIAAISQQVSKFQTAIQGLVKKTLPLLEQEEKKLKKIEASLPEKFKKDVDDIKKCKDVQSLEETTSRIFNEFLDTMHDCALIKKSGNDLLRVFDKNAKDLATNALAGIRSAKTTGIKKMTECIPKTA